MSSMDRPVGRLRARVVTMSERLRVVTVPTTSAVIITVADTHGLFSPNTMIQVVNPHTMLVRGLSAGMEAR